MWWLTVTFFLSIPSPVSFLPSHLYIFCLSFVIFSLLLLSTPIFFTSSFLYTSLSPLYTSFSVSLSLLSPPFLSLLPLFRLCKVQLGFGAFGLQAWRQEDALSEYALLGSLCVTLYFFALLFLPVVLTYFCSYFFYSYICQVTVVLSSCGFPSLMEEDPLLLISPVSRRKLVSPKKSAFHALVEKHLFTQVKSTEHVGLYFYIFLYLSHCSIWGLSNFPQTK